MVKKNGSDIKTFPKPNYLKIVYSNIKTGEDLPVFYKLRSHNFVNLWIERIYTALQQYTVDDPTRFYGLDENDILNSIDKINRCIFTINSHRPIINRTVSNPIDVDTLNYLHNIFEVYHGLLDQQTHEFFISAPDNVKKSLADLNILVHRCESCIRGMKPRHVVTYFGLAKNKVLLPEHYELFTPQYSFGSVYLNYVEIGKTLEDLAIDNDQYISEDAFQPYKHYSADFSVMFFDSSIAEINYTKQKMTEFYIKNKNFFDKLDLNLESGMLKPGRIPLADLDSHGQELLQLLKDKQFVKHVELI